MQLSFRPLLACLLSSILDLWCGPQHLNFNLNVSAETDLLLQVCSGSVSDCIFHVIWETRVLGKSSVYPSPPIKVYKEKGQDFIIFSGWVVLQCMYTYVLSYAVLSRFSHPTLCDRTGLKEPTCQCRRHKKCIFDPRVGKIPWRRKWHPTPVFFPGKSHGQRSLAGYSPCGHIELDDWSDLAQHRTAHMYTY